MYVGDIHERFHFTGETGQLREHIWHFSHRSIESMLRKTASFGAVQAAELDRSRSPVTLRRALLVPARELTYRVVVQQGWRDGFEGVVEAVYQAFSLFCVEVMLWQRQREPSLPDRYAELEREVARA